VAEVEAALRETNGPVAACRAAVSALGPHAPDALVTALLRVRDQLRCVAATGAWQVYSSIPADRGIVGRVFTTGRTAVVTEVGRDPDYIPLGPDVTVEICAPLTGADGHPVGVLNLEWTSTVEITRWRPLIEEVARLLSARLAELGGAPAETQPAETQGEQLLRHTLSITAATGESELLNRSIQAAREVSGLAAAVLLLPTSAGVLAHLGSTPGEPGGFAERLTRHLATTSQADLARLLATARGHGAPDLQAENTEAANTEGAPRSGRGFEDLTSIGVRTMIAVPAGPPDVGGALLAVDDHPAAVSPATVNLLELLGAHAWTAVERIRTLRRLHKRASSDPLTGLAHHGPFGERLNTATPGKTALLAIDVDGFKSVNDTYGHQAGDRVLVDLARALQNALRNADDLYRIGGDEFVAVIEVRGADEAVQVGERLREAARRTDRTISVGVAIQTDGEPPELTLRRADSALYQAKRAGRDRVELAR
jgi:diguanylate cyclase (GGDEF)-like protein